MRNTDKKTKLPSIKRILQNNLYSLKYIWQYSKIYLFFSLIHTLISGFYYPLLLFQTSYLFNSLEQGCTFPEALNIILLIIVIIVCDSLWNLVYSNVLLPQFTQMLHWKVQSGFFEKVRKMELRKYDDPEYYNEFVLAMQNADTYATAAMSNLNGLLSSLFSIGATLGLVIYVDPVVMVVMFASAILAMVLDTKLQKLSFQLQLDTTPINRKKEYIDRVYKLVDFSKELRLTDFGNKLIEDYDNNMTEHIAVIKNHGKKVVGLEILKEVNGRCVLLTVIAWTIYKMVVVGSVTLGGFSIITTSCISFKQSMVRFLKQFTELPKQSMNIDKVRAFMEYEPEERKGTIPAPQFESMTLENVSFGYAEGITVLHDINMTLKRGEKIAIVGYNGAGKSTLIKLLMHLYEPTDGCIRYNGRDFRAFEMDSYRSHIGAVFQDFKIFSATIGENVMGDEYTEKDYKTVEHALQLASFSDKLSALPHGIDTMLTREFDDEGTILSGGETQKIAIARVFVRPFDVVIMDEPSAALDPMAEYALNQNIAEYANDKTVIFISHRLSTTRHADRIYMLENGRIIEVGSHDELMQFGGKYAEMFTVQAEKYGEKLR